jgi:hypothetical protein
MHVVLYPTALAALAIGTLLSVTRFDWAAVVRGLRSRNLFPIADTTAMALLLGISLLAVATGSYAPFLYFRF